MKLQKCLSKALGMVLHSKLRSWLTIIGIVIGVASVIAIVSLSQGLSSSLSSQLSGLGGDILTLTPGASRGGAFFGGGGGAGGGFGGGGGSAKATTSATVLTRTDIQALRGVSDVLYADTEMRGSTNVSYLARSGSLSVTGVDPQVWSHVTTSTIAQGRFLDPTDSNVVVIGGRLAASYFNQPVGVNNVLTIDGKAFRVVGILNDESMSIYMPILMAYTVTTGKTVGQYDSIVIKIRDQNYLNQSITDIQNQLLNTRHVTTTTQDFSITSNQQLQQSRAQTLQTLSTFLLAIAGVSLIVGAIGVANTMFTSVLEKTKEIGIMKAIGARNGDILLIFIFNAALIGLVGGIIGIILGGVLSGFLPTLLGGGTPLSRSASSIISMSAVLMAIGVSAGVGVLAGIVPAYQASRLKPVDALRYD